MIGTTYAKLRAMSPEQLMDAYDKAAEHVDPGLTFIREEIARRESERQMRMMLWLTGVITLLTAANLVAVALSLR